MQASANTPGEPHLVHASGVATMSGMNKSE
jgi:hypothetical protein